MITENDRRLAKYIQFIETAHRRPSLKTIQKIARVLNVKAKDLIPF